MGNYISCTISHNAFKNCKGTKVILPNGEIRLFDAPIKAAELMFETPNYFLVNTKSLQIGRRFFALNADEDLENCYVYAMFEMKRLNSFVTAEDMGPLFITANSKQRNVNGVSAQVVPELVKTSPEKKIDVTDIEVEDFSLAEFKHRLSVCRSKKPVLETIVEER
ncbi:hypothetical protein ACHQM5_030732 [Ranunculus cassubicifolius]